MSVKVYTTGEVVTLVDTAVVPPPPPLPVSGVRYPDRDTTLSPAEQLWSDAADPGLYATGSTTKYQNQLRNKSVEPGMYYAGSNATIQWENIGGDWFDANGVLQGKTPFAIALVADKGAQVEYAVDFDVTTLVQAWVRGDFPNWGFRLQSFDAGIILWRSKYATTNHPILTIDGVDYPIGRNIGLSMSSFNSQAGAVKFQTNGTTESGMLWFDLAGVKSATRATLRVWTLDQYGNSTVNVFRVSNPAYRKPLPLVEYGVAARYPSDVGVEYDPAVAFVQKFDADYNKRWMYSTGTTPQTLITDSLLAGKYNWLEVAHVAGGIQAAIEAHVSTWRGYGALTRAKTAQPPLRLFMRYYLRLGKDWSPQPAGGKFPGFDMRFCDLTGSYVSAKDPVIAMTLPGAGRGSSGSGCDGLTGSSARGNYNHGAISSAPLSALRGFGNGDCYNALQTGPFGVDMPWNYLANVRLEEENCVEVMVEMNTVTDMTQKPRMLSGIVNNFDGTATATLMVAETDPKYRDGARWTVGGVGTSTILQNSGVYGFNQVAPITPLDSRHFKYPVPTMLAPSAVPGYGQSHPVAMCTVPCEGNPDGKIRGWINGRLACDHSDMIFRHCNWLPDGVTVNGIDAAWICVFQGGGASPTANASLRLANIIIADEYIGPMVLA